MARNMIWDDPITRLEIAFMTWLVWWVNNSRLTCDDGCPLIEGFIEGWLEGFPEMEGFSLG